MSHHWLASPRLRPRGYDQRSVLHHETFRVIRRDLRERGCVSVTLTVLHEVPADATVLSSFADPGAAIDFAQEEVRRLNSAGVAAEFVDPPEDLVGTG